MSDAVATPALTLEALRSEVEELRGRLEELEDIEDLREARAAIARNGDKPLILWEQVKAELGLSKGRKKRGA